MHIGRTLAKKNSSEAKHLTNFSLPASTPPINRQAISTLIVHSYVLELLLELLMQVWKIRSIYVDMIASNNTACVTIYHNLKIRKRAEVS